MKYLIVFLGIVLFHASANAVQSGGGSCAVPGCIGTFEAGSAGCNACQKCLDNKGYINLGQQPNGNYQVNCDKKAQFVAPTTFGGAAPKAANLFSH